MCTKQLIHELSNGLIGWYPFRKDSTVLCVLTGTEAFLSWAEILKDNDLEVSVCTPDELTGIERNVGEDGYDYVVCADALERSKNPAVLLGHLQRLIKPEGILLIAANNRFGIRYFCGDKDPYTGHVLDGIDNYVRVSDKRKEEIGGRAYTKAELIVMLDTAGFAHRKFYSVMPSVFRPQVLISEDYIPNEALDIRAFPQYQSPQTVFLEEEKLYDDLLQNGMFHPMANGFLIESSLAGELSDVSQITVSGDRGHTNSLATVIKKGKSVSKKALYREGKSKVSELLDNTEYLKQHHVPVVEAWSEGDSFVMPYVQGEIATRYFRRSLRDNKEQFLAELEIFREIIWGSSEAVPYNEVDWQQFEPDWERRKPDDPNLNKWEKLAFGSPEEQEDIGIILKRGYIDLVSLNCFHVKEGFMFFDQEFYIDNLPANVILIRTIDLIYRDCPDLELTLPREEVLKHFRLWEHREVWRRFTSVFMRELRSERELSGYHKLCRRDWRTVTSNRHRMDYTQEEYDRLFNNIFKDARGKKIYLFGSGRYAEQFITQFGQYYEIAGIVDNDENKWETMLCDIAISSPEILTSIQEPFKVFVCIKFFDSVLEQLKTMGIRNISIYDSRLDYERPLRIVHKQENTEPKKYHVGYVAGVFDLFHIGHLNLLKRAKQMCDYLIVGVVSDEQVIRDKKTSPYIPFEERLEIVRSCKYVDEAEEIPTDRHDTEDAWRRYHFDVQFSGSDYEEDPVWLAKKTFLQQHGADMVFFPYTQSTSSTKLKAEISRGK